MPVTDAVVVVTVVALVVGIPLFGLTLRLAVRPLVDAYVRVREVQLGRTADIDRLSARIEHLERILVANGVDPSDADRFSPLGTHASGVVSIPERS